MKRNPITRTLGILLSLLLLVGAVPVVSAQNIIGLIYASGIRADEDVVLWGDTTLVMDQDLTVLSIQGDYNLTIEGSGRLTVNGNGNGIAVKSLNCTSDLFIQTGWHAIEAAETVYIQNADSFIVGGIYAGGHIDIQSNNATIAGNDYAISSALGSVTLSGDTFDIGANGVAVSAKTGGIYMTGNFTVNSNNGRTIDTAKGEVVINGSLKSTSGAKFDPEVHFANRDWFSIGAASGFSFYGTTLEVTGLGGILAGVNAGYADISITADSVSIITERYYALYGNYIYVDSDELWLENEGSEENENVTYDFSTVFAEGDVTLSSESGGIVGEIALNVFGTLTLNGNFVAGGDSDYENPLILANRMEATGTLVLRNSTGLAVDVSESFSFNGQSLRMEGYGGIDADGGVNITADSTTIITSVSSPIASTGYVYIDSDYLFLQNLMEEELHPLADWAGISAYGDVTVISDDATIIGRFGIRVAEWLEDTYGNVSLRGNFHVIGTIDQAIICDNDVTVEGSLIAQGSVVEQGSDNPFNYGVCYAIDANRFSFNGTALNVEGYAGIAADNIDVTADSVVITTDVGDALNGVEVYVTANDLWAENKATKVNSDWSGQHGISAESKLALTVKGGTVIGYDDALHVYDENEQFEFHYIYVNGHLTAVSQTGAGMYAPEGIIDLNGGPIVSVGETHGIDGDEIYFEGNGLTVSGATGIHADKIVDLKGEDIKITAEGERKSGIWCENGYVDLMGEVVIETDGWYGINADTHVSFDKGYYQISGPENNAQAVRVGGTLYMDGTLEIVEPKYGHVNGNEIYGNGDSPAMELEMYSAIPEVSVYIDLPREGELPTRTASGIYFLDPRCTVEEIVWYEDGEELVSQDAVFRAGHSYTVRVILSADDPYRFLEDVMGKVNDKAVSTGFTDKKIIRLTADLGECPIAIRSVDLEIRSPEEGKVPSTAVTAASSAYGVYSRNVRWGVSTDGVNFMPMADGEKFVGGKYYRVFMDVTLAGNQYKFPTTTADGTLQPDVVSTVNGSPAVTEKAYDQDPQTVITVYFDFGKCNDYIIEEIDIVDVVAPVAGQRPTYTANMFGTGYHIDTTKNAYEDIYWKNPPEKWYYLKNGVQWWDTTTGSWEYVYENDTFIPGRTYVCQLYLAVEDGFTFATDGSLQATVNGNAAELNEGWTNHWEARVTYTFTCEENVVDRIVVDGINFPKEGQAPDYSPILGNTDLYALDTDYGLNGSGIYWYDCEGRQLEAGEVFGDAGPYRMAIKFVPVYRDGAPLCTFADEVDVMINGKYVTPYGDWDNVVACADDVWAFYTFKGNASAPEAEQTYTLSGTINVSGATVTLLQNGNVVTSITAGTSYGIENLAVGVYTLQVSKDGYETAVYSIVIATNTVQDVTLVEIVPAYTPGDLDDDGDVNNRDLALIQQYINGWDVSINVDAADVNDDGDVNNRDLALIQQYINGWDVELV